MKKGLPHSKVKIKYVINWQFKNYSREGVEIAPQQVGVWNKKWNFNVKETFMKYSFYKIPFA